MKKIELGRYQHYKGGLYEVIGAGVHSETLEEVVIYKQLYETADFPLGTLWVRPKKMFLEEVIVNNQKVPRFKHL